MSKSDLFLFGPGVIQSLCNGMNRRKSSRRREYRMLPVERLEPLQLLSATPAEIYLSPTESGSVVSSDGSTLRFSDADIIRLVMNADHSFEYSLWFDGSDVGLTLTSEDIDAFTVLSNGEIVLSTVGAYSVPSPLGRALTGGGEDLLLFTPTSLGSVTTGSWSVYLDGSDVGLSGSNETIDAVAILADGRVVVSTAGAVLVPGVNGADEDLLVFAPSSLGGTTAGRWALYFDGSDVGLTQSGEDVAALHVQETATAPTLYFATRGNFGVTGVSGANEDIFAFQPTSLGTSTAGTFQTELTFDGSLWRLAPFALDGIFLTSRVLQQQPEITVIDLSSSTYIADGQSTAVTFGSHEKHSASPTKTFRIRNDGNGVLNLGQLAFPAGFQQATPLTLSRLQPGDFVNLQVRLDTSIAGSRSGQLVIGNNDADESPFNFPIEGTVTLPPTPPPVASLFSTDFENLDRGSFNARDANGWNLPGYDRFINLGQFSNMQLVSTPAAKSGSQALQVTYAADEDAANAEVAIPNGGSSFVRTRQFMRFGSEFDFGRAEKIHRIRSFNPLTDHENWDIVVIVWGKALPGKPASDMTGRNDMHMLSVNYNGGPNDWGAVWIDNFGFERERWYEITTEVQLNTIGKSDGYVRIFVDGQLKGERTGLTIQTAQIPGNINTVMFGGWYSNGGLPPATLTRLLIDDVSISTSPGTTPPVDPPPPPTGAVLIDESFEDGRVDGFTYVPPATTQARVVTGDSFGSGSQAYQITYAADEFAADLTKDILQVNSLDVSFASKLPDGIPIAEAGRGFASLMLSRLFRDSGTPATSGIRLDLTYVRAGADGIGSAQRYEMTYFLVHSDRVFRVPVAITPDAWFQTRYFVKFNTPGHNDGVFMAWHNGQLVVNAVDIVFSDTINTRADSLAIGGGFYYRGTNPDRPFRRLIDNVRVLANGEVPTA